MPGTGEMCRVCFRISRFDRARSCRSPSTIEPILLFASLSYGQAKEFIAINVVILPAAGRCDLCFTATRSDRIAEAAIFWHDWSLNLTIGTKYMLNENPLFTRGKSAVQREYRLTSWRRQAVDLLEMSVRRS